MRAKKDPRQIAQDNYDRKIAEYAHAKAFIREIPLNKIIHVSRPTYTETITGGKTIRGWKDSGHLYVPIKINLDSFRCRILGTEASGWHSKQLTSSDAVGDELHTALRFLDIRWWKIFDPADAGLYASWAALTAEFKKAAFNA
jgi:hypothetical protein